MVSRQRAHALNRLRQTPWWGIALTAIGALFVQRLIADDHLREIFAIVSQGLGITVFVTLVAFALATVLGLVVAAANLAPWRIVREAARFYCEVLRGIPVLVLLFYMAFVAAPLLVAGLNALLSFPRARGWVEMLQLRDFDLMWRAIAALALSYSAFIAEVFRAGLEAVPRYQVEAARALGFTGWQVFRHVQLRLGFRIVLPSLGNDLVSMVKDSALVSVFGVADITQMAKVYASGSFEFFETYNIVAGLYLAMTIGLSLALRGFERRLDRHANPLQP